MSRFLVQATWRDNAPHLTEEAKRDLEASIPPYQRSARIGGIPQLGAGIVYPIPDEDILAEGVKVQPHWPRGYTLDVGWQRTAALWRAKNPDTGVSYFYDEYYRGEADPEIHAAAIRRRGQWIPGRIDPAARGRSQKDGEQLLKIYRELIYGSDRTLGVQLLQPAVNTVESGIYALLMGFQTGMVKIVKGTCPNLLAERRLYRRDEKGRIVKKFDHALDCARYSVASGDAWLAQEPAPVVEDPIARFTGGRSDAHSWMSS